MAQLAAQAGLPTNGIFITNAVAANGNTYVEVGVNLAGGNSSTWSAYAALLAAVLNNATAVRNAASSSGLAEAWATATGTGTAASVASAVSSSVLGQAPVIAGIVSATASPTPTRSVSPSPAVATMALRVNLTLPGGNASLIDGVMSAELAAAVAALAAHAGLSTNGVILTNVVNVNGNTYVEVGVNIAGGNVNLAGTYASALNGVMGNNSAVQTAIINSGAAAAWAAATGSGNTSTVASAIATQSSSQPAVPQSVSSLSPTATPSRTPSVSTSPVAAASTLRLNVSLPFGNASLVNGEISAELLAAVAQLASQAGVTTNGIFVTNLVSLNGNVYVEVAVNVAGGNSSAVSSVLSNSSAVQAAVIGSGLAASWSGATDTGTAGSVAAAISSSLLGQAPVLAPVVSATPSVTPSQSRTPTPAVATMALRLNITLPGGRVSAVNSSVSAEVLTTAAQLAAQAGLPTNGLFVTNIVTVNDNTYVEVAVDIAGGAVSLASTYASALTSALNNASAVQAAATSSGLDQTWAGITGSGDATTTAIAIGSASTGQTVRAGPIVSASPSASRSPSASPTQSVSAAASSAPAAIALRLNVTLPFGDASLVNGVISAELMASVTQLAVQAGRTTNGVTITRVISANGNTVVEVAVNVAGSAGSAGSYATSLASVMDDVNAVQAAMVNSGLASLG